MTIKKLKPADRVLTRVAWCFDELGGMVKSVRLCKVTQNITERLVDKYVDEHIRAAGKMHCCVTFDEIRY